MITGSSIHSNSAAVGTFRRPKSRLPLWLAGGAFIAVSVPLVQFALLQPQAAHENIASPSFITNMSAGVDDIRRKLTTLAASEKDAATPSIPAAGGNQDLKVLDKASGELLAQIKKTPTDLSLHNRLAFIYAGLGDLPGASEHFQAAIDLGRSQLKSIKSQEQVLEKQGDVSAAAHAMLEASKVSEQLSAAHSSLARVYDQMGQHAKVVSQLNQLNNDIVFGSTEEPKTITVANPGVPEGFVPKEPPALSGNQKTGSGADSTKGKEGVVTAAALPSNAMASGHHMNSQILQLLARGQALLQARRIQEAMQVFKHVTALDPQAAIAYQQLGRCALLSSEYLVAIQQLEIAESLDPNDSTTYNELGMAYQAQGENEHAIAMFEKSMILNPRGTEAAFNLGALEASMGRFPQAEEAFRRVLAVNPNQALAHNHLGTMYEMNGNYQGAMQEFRLAIATNPELASAHYGLGLALYNMRNYGACVPEFKRALVLNPGLLDAHNKIEQANRKRGLASSGSGV